MKVTVCIIVALCVIAVCTARPRGGKRGQRGPHRGSRGHGGDPPHRHGHHGKHGHTDGPPSETTAADADA